MSYIRKLCDTKHSVMLRPGQVGSTIGLAGSKDDCVERRIIFGQFSARSSDCASARPALPDAALKGQGQEASATNVRPMPTSDF